MFQKPKKLGRALVCLGLHVGGTAEPLSRHAIGLSVYMRKVTYKQILKRYCFDTEFLLIGLSIVEAARRTNIKVSSARNIIKKFNETGHVELAVNVGRRPKKITPEVITTVFYS